MLWRPPWPDIHLGGQGRVRNPDGVDVMKEKGHVARSSACHRASGSPPSIAPVLSFPLRDPELLLKDLTDGNRRTTAAVRPARPHARTGHSLRAHLHQGRRAPV